MIKRVLRSSLFAYLRLSPGGSLEEWRFRGICSTHILRRRKIEPRDPKVFDKKSSKPSVKVWLGITVAELAKIMHVHYDDIFECIMKTEYVDLFESTSDKVDDPVLLTQIARMLGFRCEMVKKPGIERKKPLDTEPQVEEMLRRRPNVDEKLLRSRHPVVTIMGHVDHGKTTLLDALRHSNITDQEFGAITQHISAFLVRLDDGRVITFLDTPGHAVFSKMRSRGAHATDIVVLVVAGDEGVMEQTIESIKMAKQAGGKVSIFNLAKPCLYLASIVVAINKCDKFGVDTVETVKVSITFIILYVLKDKVKRQLLEHDVIGEEFGGDVQIVPISALKASFISWRGCTNLGSTNLQTLCEAIVTQGEIMNLRADFDGLVEGVILESRLSPGKGKACVTLVQRGKLRKGLYLVAGGAWCKVRSIFDENGCSLAEAVPSMPAEVLGWRGDVLPSPGDDVIEVRTEKEAKQAATIWHRNVAQEKAAKEKQTIEERRAVERAEYLQKRQQKLNSGFIRRDPRVVYKRAKEAVTHYEGPVFHFLLKGTDVDGSLEAILDVYQTYNSAKCKFDLVHSGVGAVAENDIEIAELFNAIVYCFNVSVGARAQERADKNNVEIRHHNVIYKLVEDFRKELSSRLPLVQDEIILGAADVVKEFLVSDVGKKKTPVAGCEVTKGTISKQDYVRVLRGDEVLYEGEIVSMRREKDTVSSASAGQELGIRITDSSIRFNPGDCIICYRNEDKKQEIDWNPPGF
ncbi:translation initiation factor IF 2 [Trichuris trichiura]|uniref:Translation initiation factor IF 2 n=1 Tax=Trichuris trichiura TaxID=36087 RepID=A0A077Z2B6_TRITR|nr:translation initiation factor IF 2 [Trichuris trichiura]